MANFDIPGYELYELVGRGGMATVYRALHLNLDREVAIKVMDTSLNTDQTFSERFIREARLSANLVHPHILQIYDVNSVGSLNYISMELLEGGDLGDIIRGALNQRAIYSVMEQMTEALDYASGKGYVHRDIKPSNIMLRDDNDYVLADFGIAKAANSGTQMTQTGLMIGTPSYMSPEQARGVEVDGRSDLYSLTVLCYEMLTKKLPYDADSAVSTAVKHLTEAIPTLPGHLAVYQPFLNKGLAKNAADRFQTGAELYRAFCEVRGEFSDHDILTAPAPASGAEGTGTSSHEDSETSIGWNEATQVVSPRGTSIIWNDATQVVPPAQAPRSSRPYKLADTSQREPLLSGIRTGPRPAQKQPGPRLGSTGFRLFAGVLLIGGLSFGGYTYWQGRQSATTQDLHSLTAELALAYGALNTNDLARAAAAFGRVLEIDSNHVGAQQGLLEVEVVYIAGIEDALSSGDLQAAERQFLDYTLLFSNSGNVERIQARLAQAQQSRQLASVQSERVDILLEKAGAAYQQGKLFEPASDNAHDFYTQVLAIDADNAMARNGLDKLAAAGLDGVYTHISNSQLGQAWNLLDRVRQINPELPSLAQAQSAIERAEEGEPQQQRSQTDQIPEPQDDVRARQVAVDATVDSLLERARAGAEAGDLAGARNALEEAAALAPQRDDIADLQERLPAMERARNAKTQLAENIEDAQALFSDGQFGEAAAAYGKALALDANSPVATKGFDDSIASLMRAANTAVEKGDFSSAREALTAVTAIAPGEEVGAQLLLELPRLEQEWQQQREAFDQEARAATELANTGMTAVANGDLDMAADTYGQLAGDYPQFDATLKLKSRLLNAYVETARDEITNQQYDAAEEYLGRGKMLAPDYAAWAELTEEIEVSRASNRRRLGAY